jgi:hypothetical protein
MIKTGFYPFLTNDDILLIGLVGLALVLRNWWDLIRYGLQRSALAAAVPVPPRLIATGPEARVPRVLRVLRRMHSRRRIVPRSIEPGHRPVRRHA